MKWLDRIGAGLLVAGAFLILPALAQPNPDYLALLIGAPLIVGGLLAIMEAEDQRKAGRRIHITAVPADDQVALLNQDRPIYLVDMRDDDGNLESRAHGYTDQHGRPAIAIDAAMRMARIGHQVGKRGAA